MVVLRMLIFIIGCIYSGWLVHYHYQKNFGKMLDCKHMMSEIDQNTGADLSLLLVYDERSPVYRNLIKDDNNPYNINEDWIKEIYNEVSAEKKAVEENGCENVGDISYASFLDGQLTILETLMELYIKK